jgi:hypothetical protein
MIRIEKLSDDELEMLSKNFEAIRIACESRKGQAAALRANGKHATKQTGGV